MKKQKRVGVNKMRAVGFLQQALSFMTANDYPPTLDDLGVDLGDGDRAMSKSMVSRFRQLAINLGFIRVDGGSKSRAMSVPGVHYAVPSNVLSANFSPLDLPDDQQPKRIYVAVSYWGPTGISEWLHEYMARYPRVEVVAIKPKWRILLPLDIDTRIFDDYNTLRRHVCAGYSADPNGRVSLISNMPEICTLWAALGWAVYDPEALTGNKGGMNESVA